MTILEQIFFLGRGEPINISGLEALKDCSKYSFRLQYVPASEQTEEICLAAIKQDPSSLRYVRNQTAILCLAAVRRSGKALKYVSKQTPEICLAAVQQDPEAIENVDMTIFNNQNK